jgi:hypothetical protein
VISTFCNVFLASRPSNFLSRADGVADSVVRCAPIDKFYTLDGAGALDEPAVQLEH